MDIDAKKLPRVGLRSNIDDTHFVTKDKESVKDDTQILLRVNFFLVCLHFVTVVGIVYLCVYLQI